MFGWFRKDRAAPAVPASEPAYPAPAAAEMRWRSDATLPIPDWEAMDVAGGGASDAFLHDWYTAAARRWMEALGRALPDGQYSQRASDDFLLLSSLPDRTADLVLERCEQARRAIRQRLGSIGKDEGYGPHVVVVFASQDSYYAYLEHYGPRGDGRALSSGVFLDAGYGHFASWHDGLDELEPVVAHELTHALLRHLDLPVWLNEGLARTSSTRWSPRWRTRACACTPRPRCMPATWRGGTRSGSKHSGPARPSTSAKAWSWP